MADSDFFLNFDFRLAAQLRLTETRMYLPI